eukprot:TRINITY_DN1037_c0_g1_i1.p2 TRINITY_DN1037_c0_g1~~TRINITY_DN1037_c0_g1_i1.p2  ORF type:complete len:111 (+),score=34.98 TRINITY_DN1037_c0_g1_i1:235-567(+)
MDEAKLKALYLFRTTLRSARKIKGIYQLDIPEQELKANLSDMFRKNAGVRDPKVSDMLVWRGEQELEEALAHWKQKTQVLRFLEIGQPKNRLQQVRSNTDPLARFFAGEF